MKHIVRSEHILACAEHTLSEKLEPEVKASWDHIKNTIRYNILYNNQKVFDLEELGVNEGYFYEWFFDTNPDV